MGQRFVKLTQDCENYLRDEPEQNGEFHDVDYGDQPFRYEEYGNFDPLNGVQYDDEYWPPSDSGPDEEDTSSNTQGSPEINLGLLVKPDTTEQLEDARFIAMCRHIVLNFFEKFNTISKGRCTCERCLEETLNLAVALSCDPDFTQPAFEAGDCVATSRPQQVARLPTSKEEMKPRKKEVKKDPVPKKTPARKRKMIVERINSPNNILEKGESSAKRHRKDKAEDDSKKEDDEDGSSSTEQDQEEFTDEDDPTQHDDGGEDSSDEEGGSHDDRSSEKDNANSCRIM